MKPTPEDYEPEEWEYYQYPISRFFAKYISWGEQALHEILMGQQRDYRMTILQAQLKGEVRMIRIKKVVIFVNTLRVIELLKYGPN